MHRSARLIYPSLQSNTLRLVESCSGQQAVAAFLATPEIREGSCTYPVQYQMLGQLWTMSALFSAWELRPSTICPRNVSSLYSST